MIRIAVLLVVLSQLSACFWWGDIENARCTSSLDAANTVRSIGTITTSTARTIITMTTSAELVAPRNGRAARPRSAA